jgi:hypothetical protein
MRKPLTKKQLDQLNKLISSVPPIENIAPDVAAKMKEGVKENFDEIFKKYDTWLNNDPNIIKYKNSMTPEMKADDFMDDVMAKIVEHIMIMTMIECIEEWIVFGIVLAGVGNIPKEQVNQNIRTILKDTIISQANKISTNK